MYKTQTAPVLEPADDARVALMGVNIEAVFENLLCQVTVRQIYRNLETINIEAVYTFPLPMDAVLLDMTIITKTRKLKGVVVEKSEAERRYENAVVSGDTAIMLEQIEPGLYTMNVGNLQPEDEVEISVTYAELYRWSEDQLRFFLPTTVAPRYGDPENAGLQPHQFPEYDLIADNRYRLSITLKGMLAEARVQCPSHKPVIIRDEKSTRIAMEGGRALMDRDFILNIFRQDQYAPAAFVDNDIDGYIITASFFPKFPKHQEHSGRNITILLDCSGSMTGDSIRQSRKALREILDFLSPYDTFNIIRFGSDYEKLFSSLVSANIDNLNRAGRLLRNLNADMGGTEIGKAVSAAIHQRSDSEKPKEVLLITDGEVWEWQKVTRMAERSGVRFFTVGVGHAVSEAFVKTLAEVTGGACELVSPNENMAEKIVRHFKRIYLPKAEDIQISWPIKPEKMIPGRIMSIYDGDTLHVFGRFREKPKGQVGISARLETGEVLSQNLKIEEKPEYKASDPTDEDQDIMSKEPMPDIHSISAAARMAAAMELKSLQDDQAIAELAVRYQIMSRRTNYLAIEVKPEGEKATDLPALRKTPQMLAAGWGGTGYEGEADDTVTFCRRRPSAAMPVGSDIDLCFDLDEAGMDECVERPGDLDAVHEFQSDLSGYKRDLPREDPVLEEDIQSDEKGLKPVEPFDIHHFIDRINRMHQHLAVPSLQILSIDDLKTCGVPDDMVEALAGLIDRLTDEQTIVVIFLHLLTRDKAFDIKISRDLKRMIAKVYMQTPKIDNDTVQAVENIILQNGLKVRKPDLE